MNAESEQVPSRRVEFLGSEFDLVDQLTAVDRVVAWCRARGRARTIITHNAGVLMMMRRDARLAAACRAGDLILADGVSVVWASHLIGTPLPARVTGVDLMGALLDRCSREGLRVFFLGAKREVLERLAALCAERFRGLVVAGMRDGYFSSTDHARVIEEIRESRADILFVGMPTPFKEIWCEEHRDEFGVSVIMGVGGSFDVWAGVIRRAPQWMQWAGLEWSWRLMMEPRKMWKRYLVTNTQFIGQVARETVARRLGRASNDT